MALITWTEEQFGTKISESDQQHQQLFQMLNTLHDTISGGDREEIGKQLEVFLDYVAMHFQMEERILKENDYPGYADHKAEHDKLLQTAAEVKKGFLEEGKDLTQDTTTFISDWLTDHIPTIDKPYGPFLNEKGIT